MKPLHNPPANVRQKTAPQSVGAKLSAAQRTGAPIAPVLRNNAAQQRVSGANRGASPIQLHKGLATSPPQPPAHNCKGLACHATGAQRGAGAKAHPGAAAAAQANRNLAQPRTGTPQRVENRAQAAASRGAQASASAAAKAPSYVVHAPPVIGGSGQQIKATIKGTPQIAGSLDIKPIAGGKVYISNLTVERQHRRQGLANQLMSAAMSAARNHGFSGAQLEARPSDSGITSQALVAMYQRLGFKSVGKTRRGNPLMERRF